MLTLRELFESDEQAFRTSLKEWDGQQLSWFTLDWKPSTPFSDHLDKLRNNRQGINIPDDWVPSTMLYGFVDGTIVGRLNIQHRLTEKLLHRGGHIGYAVAPRYRGQGYATAMVRQSLPYARVLGITRALITCGESNMASWKIIEKVGGQLENKVWDEKENEMFRRYWVDL
jgi:predicted acetyltransferase